MEEREKRLHKRRLVNIKVRDENRRKRSVAERRALEIYPTRQVMRKEAAELTNDKETTDTGN